MPTVWVQQFGPGLYVERRSLQTGHARVPPCAFAIGLSVAPVGRVPEAMHSSCYYGTAFGILAYGVAASHPSYSAPWRDARLVNRARARATCTGVSNAVSDARTIHVSPPSTVSRRTS